MLIGRVVGASTVQANLAQVPVQAKAEIRKTIAGLTLEILRKVKAEKLSGQVLKNCTGTLRRSINQRMIENGLGIVGSVGTKLSYARIWELGFDGPVKVQAHLRLVKQAWGRPLKSPVRARVQAHVRTLKVKPRPYLRPILDEMRDEIRARLEAAIRGGIR